MINIRTKKYTQTSHYVTLWYVAASRFGKKVILF